MERGWAVQPWVSRGVEEVIVGRLDWVGSSRRINAVEEDGGVQRGWRWHDGRAKEMFYICS